ncbi:DUF4224 domain-containing protein [Idiomarina piscisalsi]|uniref:DUF4224 domain-containing protein n=1 Tax=Idiomarina piscisalsi TaxID=1096243 RepID=A0A432YXB9_9GAMM|nr:DUF4224 domain-containing protein [Idiomarina piscisalsi]RUO67976.1 hypothetical protein CWI73_03730 [Idiomarina piscisalsi]
MTSEIVSKEELIQLTGYKQPLRQYQYLSRNGYNCFFNRRHQVVLTREAIRQRERAIADKIAQTEEFARLAELERNKQKKKYSRNTGLIDQMFEVA